MENEDLKLAYTRVVCQTILDLFKRFNIFENEGILKCALIRHGEEKYLELISDEYDKIKISLDKIFFPIIKNYINSKDDIEKLLQEIPEDKMERFCLLSGVNQKDIDHIKKDVISKYLLSIINSVDKEKRKTKHVREVNVFTILYKELENFEEAKIPDLYKPVRLKLCLRRLEKERSLSVGSGKFQEAETAKRQKSIVEIIMMEKKRVTNSELVEQLKKKDIKVSESTVRTDLKHIEQLLIQLQREHYENK